VSVERYLSVMESAVKIQTLINDILHQITVHVLNVILNGGETHLLT
jgi:hypothetical protein